LNRPRLIVGCPVLFRDWILPLWFAHVVAACDAAGFDPSNADDVMLVFVGDRDRDIDTYATILDMVDSGVEVRFWQEQDIRGIDRREWDPMRYDRMVVLRNRLLGEVRSLAPDLFLSLDSDILLAPDALKSAMEGLDRFDAVGMRTFMTPEGTSVPNWANLNREGGLQRQDHFGMFFGVEILMAAKLMKPAAYAVDYDFHLEGEDIGWSIAARMLGLKLGWDGRTGSKHVLSPEMLDVVDDRVGF